MHFSFVSSFILARCSGLANYGSARSSGLGIGSSRIGQGLWNRNWLIQDRFVARGFGRIARDSISRARASPRSFVCGDGLTRVPLRYFYNAPPWGAISSPPPLISETTGPILKIQTAFESPGKTVEGKQILLTSGSRVTSQVRSKSKCSTFRPW